MMFFFLSLPVRADETALFAPVPPDLLIIEDLSASMLWTPAGEKMYTLDYGSCDSLTNPFYTESGPGHTKACTIDTGFVPKWGDPACLGPFTRTAGGAQTTECSRVMIAQRALYSILDDDQNGTINNQDERSLGIRFGYMRFYNCRSDETNGDYNAGCIALMAPIGTSYQNLWNGQGTWSGLSGTTSGAGGTPLASALGEAKIYLDAHKAADSAAACRKKFVLLITDGADTYACGGTGREDQTDQYRRRRETVARAKALADAGYKVFVVGFGAAMPHWLRHTMNWAAYHGGTDNSLAVNSGETSAYDPASVASCQSSPTAQHDTEGDGAHSYATAADPGENPLSGYAFLASQDSDLAAALKQTVSTVREALYSFSLPSIASSRTEDENYLYEPSFQPVSNDPFWPGHLKKYGINADGSPGDLIWEAGAVLQSTPASGRNILTLQGGRPVPFTTAYISRERLAVATDRERDGVVGYLRGEDEFNPDRWKLGDIFHSNPVTLATPSVYFNDMRDGNGAFALFRAAHPRTSANGLRLILAGANDGQIHAFRASDGVETWSFIPPNFLPRLKNLAHGAHPTGLVHQLFLDGAVTAADVWLGTGEGTAKSVAEWKTLVVFGEGRGGSTSLWSSSPSCEAGFSSSYGAGNPYYCGYYAFDFTDPLSPAYFWRVHAASSQAPYLGEPWSKMVMGRVLVGGNEKWVGFMGGGYNAADCSGGGRCETRGKGFFVIDLASGEVLWSFTRADHPAMNYSLPATPAVVDTDNDGLVDTAYAGDLGGNMWRFKFCGKTDSPSCQAADWSGGLLFESSGAVRPIYSSPAVAKDANGNFWVYWGTGDKTDPAAANAQERFFAVKEDRQTTIGINSLENITLGTYVDGAGKKGWFFNLTGQGEKILADPTVFGGVVYFSSFTPQQGGNPCSQSGVGSLYGVHYLTGAGILIAGVGGDGGGVSPPVRKLEVGSGIPSTPVISFKPAAGSPDIYVMVSGGAGQNETTSRMSFNPPTLANRTNILFWKDLRLR